MIKKAVHKIKMDNENGARKAILEDLFYDFHRSRHQVYLMNFIRGISFGVGSVLGGTVVIAVLLWLLSLLVNIPGGVGDFVHFIVNTVNQHPKS
jgi:hypothetical protein